MARERLNKENHKEDIEKHAGDVGARGCQMKPKQRRHKRPLVD